MNNGLEKSHHGPVQIIPITVDQLCRNIQLLEAGEAPPAEFTRSEVAEVLLSSVKDGDSVGPLRGEVEGLSGYLDPSQESQVKDRLAARGYL